MKGNTVKVWWENGRRLAQSQKVARVYFGEQPTEAPIIELPDGLPNPPAGFSEDPGIYRRGQVITGRRRPTWGIQDPKWASHRWRGGGCIPWDLLHVWLSQRQQDGWYRQVKCPYCGAGVGVSCVGRRILYGMQEEEGQPKVCQSSVSYHHQLRKKSVLYYTVQFDRQLVPDWVWWASHAVGEDPDALLTCLSDVRGAAWAIDYVSRLKEQ